MADDSAFIILKRSSFVPDNYVVDSHTTITFENDDDFTHKIHCNGNDSFPSLTIEPGGRKSHKFSTNGRFLLSSVSASSMKVFIFKFAVFKL